MQFSTSLGLLRTHDTFSYACAISDGDIVVVTGGFQHKDEVSVYNIHGFIRYLPNLLKGRQYHACAAYQNDDGEKVEVFIIKSDIVIPIIDLPSNWGLRRHYEHTFD